VPGQRPVTVPGPVTQRRRGRGQRLPGGGLGSSGCGPPAARALARGDGPARAASEPPGTQCPSHSYAGFKFKFTGKNFKLNFTLNVTISDSDNSDFARLSRCQSLTRTSVNSESATPLKTVTRTTKEPPRPRGPSRPTRAEAPASDLELELSEPGPPPGLSDRDPPAGRRRGGRRQRH
jgi:hypothetical protein